MSGRGRGGRGGRNGNGNGEGSGSGSSVVQGMANMNLKDEKSRGGGTGRVDVVKTKPETLTSKRGTGGDPCNLITNYFGLKTKMDMRLNSYRLDFNRKIELTAQKKALIRRLEKQLPTNICDGE